MIDVLVHSTSWNPYFEHSSGQKTVDEKVIGHRRQPISTLLVGHGIKPIPNDFSF